VFWLPTAAGSLCCVCVDLDWLKFLLEGSKKPLHKMSPKKLFNNKKESFMAQKVHFGGALLK
jgi:hypothetical protein